MNPNIKSVKSYIIYFCFLSFISVNYIGLNAQEQSQQEETQSAGTTQVTQNNTTEVAQPQTQTPAVIKPKPFADELSIEDQFSFAIEKSSNFQDYKVIKQNWMSKLKQNTIDTLQYLKVNLKSSKEVIEEKTKLLASLNSELSAAQSDLIKKNSFSFFGLMVSKTGYDTIMWSIIIGLIVGLGFMFAAFRRSFAITTQTKKDLLEVKDEFEVFRKKALKSKEEAVRQLYDELNKYKNMK